jgi:hypothetical protein
MIMERYARATNHVADDALFFDVHPHINVFATTPPLVKLSKFDSTYVRRYHSSPIRVRVHIAGLDEIDSVLALDNMFHYKNRFSLLDMNPIHEDH